jgi:hypothetical protein
MGKEATISTLAQVQVQVKIGICISFMPGARILMMVTRKLIAVSVVPIPDICSAQV